MTHNAKVLALLSDGDVADLLELRARGFDVRHKISRGKHYYRLIQDCPEEPCAPPLASADSLAESDAADVPTASSGQLVLGTA